MFLQNCWPNYDNLLKVNSQVDFEGNFMVGKRGQKNAHIHPVLGLKSKFIVELKKQNHLFILFCTAQDISITRCYDMIVTNQNHASKSVAMIGVFWVVSTL